VAAAGPPVPRGPTATGLTNEQIAERAVSPHPYQLIPELGITSRAALRDALGALNPR